jgi:hypothetical protein
MDGVAMKLFGGDGESVKLSGRHDSNNNKPLGFGGIIIDWLLKKEFIFLNIKFIIYRKILENR